VKVGVDARQLSGPIVGTARALRGVLRAWAEAGIPHEVFLYCPRPFRLDFPNHFHNRIGCGVGRFTGGTLWLQTELCRMAGRDRVEAFWGTTDMLPLPLARKVPCLLTVQDLVYYSAPGVLSPYVRAMYRLFFGRSLDAAARIMTTTAAIRNDLVAMGFPASKITAVHLGVDLPSFSNPRGDAGALMRRHALEPGYFLFAGYLRPNKNLERTLLAFKSFLSGVKSGPKPMLVLAGGRTRTDSRIFELLNDPALRERVKYVGFAPENDLPLLYSKALAFVSPATYEGFGLPYVEAMAAGLPIIASSIPTAREVCGEAAQYADPLKPETIESAFSLLWRDEALRERLRLKSLERAKEFGWPSVARRVLQNLEAVAR